MKFGPDFAKSPSHRGRRRLAAAAVAGGLAAGAAAACGGANFTGTANADIANTYVVVDNNGKGQVLLSDRSSDGQLKDNRKGWANTTLDQALMAGLSTGDITPMAAEQLNTICAPNGKACGVGTVLTTTPTSNGPDKWYVRSDVQIGSSVPKGKAVVPGHDYYVDKKILSVAQADELAQVAGHWGQAAIQKEMGALGLGDMTGVKDMTFVYPPGMNGNENMSGMASDIHNFGYNGGVGVDAKPNTYGLAPADGDPSQVMVIEWMPGSSQ